jgi:hypothetical protein
MSDEPEDPDELAFLDGGALSGARMARACRHQEGDDIVVADVSVPTGHEKRDTHDPDERAFGEHIFD